MDKPTSSQPASKYGQEYLEWKNWGNNESFSRLDKHIESSYSEEIARTELLHIRDVLEIGFGNGSFLTYARNRNWNIVGTEMNPTLVAQARSLGFDARNSNAIDSMEVEHFDLIVAFDVLEHIHQNEIPAFLASVRTLLRHGGVFLARFPNADSPFGLPYQHGDVTHVTAIGSAKVEYFARMLDFDIVYIGGDAHPLWCGSYLHFCHRLIANPIKKILEIFVKIIFFPTAKVTFFSSNIVIALKKTRKVVPGNRTAG